MPNANENVSLSLASPSPRLVCDVAFFICPIAITYSMGQIKKIGLRLYVCVCLSVCLSVCRHSQGRISLSIFTKFDTKVKNPKSKHKFVGGQYRPTPSPMLPLKIAIFGLEVLKIHANMKNATSALNVHVSPKFPRIIGNRGRGTRC